MTRPARRLHGRRSSSVRATSTRTAPPAATARGGHGRNPRSVQLRPWPHQGRLPAACDGVSAALRARSLDHRHGRRRQGQGGLQVRRDRSRHGRGDGRAQGRRRRLGDRLEAVRRGEDPALRLRPLRQRRSPASSSSAWPIRRGPTGGKLLRPSDGKEAKNVAFIQCAGSRDENHLRHCSRICCMASLKQTQYVREAYGEDGKSTVYYIDIRAIDRFEDFYRKVQERPDGHVHQVQGGAHRRGPGDRQPGAARRRHRGLPPLRQRARSRRAGDRHGAREQRHRAAGRRIRGFVGLHRGLQATAACSAPARASPARRQPRGAERARPPRCARSR